MTGPGRYVRATLIALWCVLSGTVSLPTASAYVLDEGTIMCAGNSQWKPPADPTSSYRYVPVRPMCYTRSWPTNPAATATNVASATHWAFNQWSQEGLSSVRLYYSYACRDDGRTSSDGSWFDDGNEGSEIWWSPSSDYDNGSCGNWGCTQWDREFCLFSGDNEYLATDIDINMNGALGAGIISVESDTMARCLSNQLVTEDIIMHEIGHAYGLMHNDAWLTTMNSTVSSGNRKCDFGDGWHLKPWSDESQGMMAMYDQGLSEYLVDVSGSHRFGPSGGLGETRLIEFFCQSTGSVLLNGTPTTPFRWTFANHYDNPGGFYFRYHLVPSATSTDPVGSSGYSSGWYAYSSASTFPGASFSVTAAFNADTRVMTAGIYRVWIQLLPLSGTNMDPGDDLFPTVYQVQIGAC